MECQAKSCKSRHVNEGHEVKFMGQVFCSKHCALREITLQSYILMRDKKLEDISKSFD